MPRLAPKQPFPPELYCYCKVMPGQCCCVEAREAVKKESGLMDHLHAEKGIIFAVHEARKECREAEDTARGGDQESAWALARGRGSWRGVGGGAGSAATPSAVFDVSNPDN